VPTPVIAAGGIHNFETGGSGARQRQRRQSSPSLAKRSLADPDWFCKVMNGRGHDVRLCLYTNYCEALDQRHRQVTCELWDRKGLDEPGVKPVDGRKAPAHGAALVGSQRHVRGGCARPNWGTSPTSRLSMPPIRSVLVGPADKQCQHCTSLRAPPGQESEVLSKRSGETRLVAIADFRAQALPHHRAASRVWCGKRRQCLPITHLPSATQSRSNIEARSYCE